MRGWVVLIATLSASAARAGETLRFQSTWLDPGGGSGDTPMEIGPAARGSAAAEGGAWVGRYPFGEGGFYGCYDPARRVFEGVWIQERLSTACAEPRFGAEIWGHAHFQFDAEHQRFEGWYTFCDEAERYGWSGARDAGLGPVTGAKISGAPLCEAEPVS